jgi:5-(carboxyamino)imidazole ribonucleotide mutase
MMSVPVSVFVGSESDRALVTEACLKKLKEIGLGYDLAVCSAHRDPEMLPEFVNEALELGAQLFIGYAGLTPALPGAIAAHARSTPVIGISDTAEEHRAISNTAPGLPVAYIGWGKSGLIKAAEFAALLLGWKHQELSPLQATYIKNLGDKKPPKLHLDRWDPEEETS